jgi:hypothetical protein
LGEVVLLFVLVFLSFFFTFFFFRVATVDGILMDIGVSSMQLDIPSRGFSFRENYSGKIDMRMDQPGSDDGNDDDSGDSKQRDTKDGGVSARTLIYNLSEQQLSDLIWQVCISFFALLRLHLRHYPFLLLLLLLL